MLLSPLTAVSPVDGRYHSRTAPLAPYYSEYATIRYRLLIEVEYLIALSAVGLPQLPALPQDKIDALRKIYAEESFTPEEAQKIKDTERITNHDVKAVEYYLKGCLDNLGLSDIKEFVHFGLTSQDINNTAFPLMLLRSLSEVIVPAFSELIDMLSELALEWKNIPMLAHTHGQPASPTGLGKEIDVFRYRLAEQLGVLGTAWIDAKFGGATGNFNAHHVAYPDIDWATFGEEFLNSLGLSRELISTQISSYDNMAQICHNLVRLANIVTDLDRDIWSYISMGYFRQRVKAGEVGSSAMPHKVNPIDFENSEGNMGVAVALLEHLAHKLPISRLQRDLTDSTVLRNLGVPMAHILIALDSTKKGLGKLIVDEKTISADLDANTAVVAEALQTILRREGYPQPYEALKALTRTGRPIDRAAIDEFIDSLEGISDSVRAELRAVTPHNYTGNALTFDWIETDDEE
ncbi:MAG: adenylosuccinate lyase [Muribaculaceae bacterium]|nr:adenylosuccinate lyase [Muribaculaceae bacterium]